MGEPDGHRSCVASVPIFATLTPQEQAAVGTFARPTRLGRGEQLYGMGDPVSRLFVVHRGRVRVLHVTPDGTEHLLRIAGPGDVVGEHAFVTGEPPDHRVVALDDAVMCVFDHRDLAALLAAHPAIVMRMLQSVTSRLSALERRLAAQRASDVTARLADYLLNLPGEGRAPLSPGRAGVRVRLPMSKKDLASYLGTTPESLSRALRRMGDEGAITSGRGPVLVIDDARALRRLSHPD